MLVHDLLLTKRGVSAPASHPLRLAVEKHKVRLNAEFTRIRVKKGFRSLHELRTHVEAGNCRAEQSTSTNLQANKEQTNGHAKQYPHPRWVRINTINTSLDEQLDTTFADYASVSSIEELLSVDDSFTRKKLHIDKHIPYLLAVSPFTDLSKSQAYWDGQIILQDKASCFPAYLLDPKVEKGACLDACAAPGNKTTHLVALLQQESQVLPKGTVFACERDGARAMTLRQITKTAGVEHSVTIKAKQDFLQLNPDSAPWNAIGSILLDPSCSGSGIVGREEGFQVDLPQKEAKFPAKSHSRKRKYATTIESSPSALEFAEETSINENKEADQLSTRLTSLSTFQLKLLLHAFKFPRAHKIVYSTCSIYAEENEQVVMKALDSSTAKERGWRILPRNEQISGMRAWEIRGDVQACRKFASPDVADPVAEACIRCDKGTSHGTQGFFVAGFVRQDTGEPSVANGEADDEWEGLSDGRSVSSDGAAA